MIHLLVYLVHIVYNIFRSSIIKLRFLVLLRYKLVDFLCGKMVIVLALKILQ
jgi:hypothetical protein